MKNTYLVMIWIAGILLVGWVLFFFTEPIRNNQLLQSVNKALSRTEDAQRLEKLIPKASTRVGKWYSVVDSENRALVFSIINEGISVPFVAFVNAKNVEIFPLNNHARYVLEQLPQGIINIYTSRIKGDWSN